MMFAAEKNSNSSGSTTLIEGTVVGNITSADESSRIRVLNSGSVIGDITVATIVINGSVRGELHAGELIKLAAKAVVQGSVNYKLIEIEKGAEVVGSFVYHQSPSNVTQFPADSKELSN
jgi:cytoskeletal protein CcmA (bactofilin family)